MRIILLAILILLLFLFVTLNSDKIFAQSCWVVRSCSERPFRICRPRPGNLRCVQWSVTNPKVCLRDMYVQPGGELCIDDWETVCTSQTVCRPAPRVPVYNPPPNQTIPKPEPEPEPQDPCVENPSLCETPIDPCEENPSLCEDPIESDKCDDKSGPVWLRILSLEDGKTVSWKPKGDVVPANGRFSVPVEEGGGLDIDGYFKKYRAYSYTCSNGERRDFRGADLKNFDKSKNINDLNLNFSLVNTATGRNWSNHFCGNGRAICPADKDGNLTGTAQGVSGKYIAASDNPCTSSNIMCDRCQESANAQLKHPYCSYNRFGGETINICQEDINQVLAENPPASKFDADEDPHKNRADPLIDAQDVCRIDFDGCSSDALKGGIFPNQFGSLNSLMEFASDKLPQYDIRYDEYWTMSYFSKYKQGGSEDGSTVTIKFDDEWEKEYFQCQTDLQSYIKIDNLPEGYICDDIKIIKPGNDKVIDKNTTAGDEFKYAPNETKDLVRVFADGTCKALFTGGGEGVMVLPILKKDDRCKINLNTNISCSADYTQATLNWQVEENSSTPIDFIRYQVNKDPLATFIPDSNGDLQGDIDKSLRQFTVTGLEPERLYEATIQGIDNGNVACSSMNVPFRCEAPRPNLCQSTIIYEDKPAEDYFILRTLANQPVTEFFYAIYNRNNIDSLGNPKPLCVPYSGGITEGCPNGTQQLTFNQIFDTKSSRSNLELKYSEVFINDLNNSSKKATSVMIKAFFRDPDLDEGRYTGENSACNIGNSLGKITYGNKLPQLNVYNNLGRFRKVGEWTVDLTPPVANTPVTSNYLYDSFDTEWRVKTDTQLLDTSFGCYNLSTNPFGVTYLGYLDEFKKYRFNQFNYDIPFQAFSSIYNSFPFENRISSIDTESGNTLLDPLSSPFPNCVNLDTINVFKQKVNQADNLLNGGVDVALKTKFKLEQPENFETFQHAFKATDLACNTKVSDPGGAGIALPDGWISTDGGTVYYSVDDTTAKSPEPPATNQHIDQNLYCSYNYGTDPLVSKIFYTDANTDNALLDISKSIVLNDNQGKSFVGAKEEDYAPGDDLLLSILGQGNSHYSSLLNQIKSQTPTINYNVVNPTLNTIAQTGCDPDDSRCYIELNGNVTINGDQGIPSPGNYFCDKNALFFINGNLTIKDNVYKSDYIDSCCGFIVNGDINFESTYNANGYNYNKARYEQGYLTYPNVDWYNTYECSTGFYFSEKNITIQKDQTNIPISSTGINLSDPLRIKGDLLAQQIVNQNRSNGIGNLSRPAIYLSKDACIMNNFPELTYALLKTRERDFVTNE